MPVLQSTFTETVTQAYPGMVANGETSNRLTRSIETSGGIAFGKVAYRGTGDHGIVTAQTLTGAGSAGATNVGTSTITASPTVGAQAIIGRYVITQLATSATGALVVTAPNGATVAHGVVGTAITTIPGITSVTVTSGGTATIGDQFYIDVTGNEALGIVIATVGIPLIAGQTADTYQQYANVPIMTRGAIWVTAGGTVADGSAAQVDTNGDFVSSGGIPLTGWIFDTDGSAAGLVKIARR